MSTMPAPHTWGDGELVTAALLNTYVRDSFLATFAKLDSTVFGSSQANIVFNSISTNYHSLLLVGGYISDTSAAALQGRMQFNGDGGANYNQNVRFSTGSAVGAVDFLGTTDCIGIGVSGSVNAVESAGYVLIRDYKSTVTQKQYVGGYFSMGSTAAGSLAVTTVGGVWNSGAAALSLINIYPSAGGFLHGAMTLYGIGA